MGKWQIRFPLLWAHILNFIQNKEVLSGIKFEENMVNVRLLSLTLRKTGMSLSERKRTDTYEDI